MKELEVFITVHDQERILDFESSKSVKHLSSYKYVFVGNGDITKVSHLDNIVVARQLPFNIEEEEYKLLVSYTAWYALVMNNLIDSEYVALIHYDVKLNEDFERSTLSCLQTNGNQILGYVPFSMLHRDFLEINIGTHPLFIAMQNNYHVDIYDLIKEYIARTNDTTWPSADQIAVSAPMLCKFVKWFIPLINDLKLYRGCGHSFERSIKFFCILNNIPNSYMPNVLKHYQLDSHGTQFTQKRPQSLKNIQ
ncbi:hypothetical protein [Sporomusa malonica]|nr:hypothetical protein [Sporomusa malonica]